MAGLTLVANWGFALSVTAPETLQSITEWPDRLHLYHVSVVRHLEHKFYYKWDLNIVQCKPVLDQARDIADSVVNPPT